MFFLEKLEYIIEKIKIMIIIIITEEINKILS